jgi:hypothetical protein
VTVSVVAGNADKLEKLQVAGAVTSPVTVNWVVTGAAAAFHPQLTRSAAPTNPARQVKRAILILPPGRKGSAEPSTLEPSRYPDKYIDQNSQRRKQFAQDCHRLLG